MSKPRSQLSVVGDQPKPALVAPAPSQVTVVESIPLSKLVPNPANPRKTMDQAKVVELAQTIRTSGIMIPLTVRVFASDGPGPFYEIVCGHRRAVAAELAGLKEVPCIVRELTDAQAADVALIDNLQRADVEALEEAAAFAELLVRYGSEAALAAAVGKEVSHITKRLRLMELGLNQRDALRERLITVDHALYLARLGADQQDEQLKWLLDSQAGVKKTCDKVLLERVASIEEWKKRDTHYAWEPPSPQRLKEHIEQCSGRKLSRAPWRLDDAALLDDVGACTTCPLNTQANTSLFGDLDMEEATCADGSCFERKRAAFVLVQIQDAAKAKCLREKIPGKTPSDYLIPRVSWKATSVVPRQLKDGPVNPEQTFKHGQWVEATKACEQMRVAVTVDWSDANDRGHMGRGEKLRKPGEVVIACIEPKCKAHPKAYEAVRTESGQQKREDPAEAEKRKETQAFLEKTENVVRAKVWNAVLGKLTPELAIHMVADDVRGAAACRKDILAHFPGISGALLEALVVFVDNFENHVTANGYYMTHQTDGVAKDRKELWDLAKRVGLDADEIAVRHFFESGIAPAADPLYPKKTPKLNKFFEQLRKEAGGGKAAPKKALAKKATKTPTKKQAAKKAAKKAGRK